MEPVPWPAGFDAPAWLWQLKWDGARCLAAAGGEPVLWSRRGRVWTERFPEVAAELRAASGGAAAVLDGELVAPDASGRPSFPRLLRRAGRTAPDPATVAALPVALAVFDVLQWDGDLRRAPLETRLGAVGALRPTPHIRPVGTSTGDGTAFVAAAAAAGLEGAVAKRPGSPYTPGPSPDWRKIKPRRMLTAPIAGWVSGPGTALRSLALAVPAGPHLAYIGDVGSGLGEALRQRLGAALRAAPPGEPPLPTPPARAGTVRHWVQPALAARVRFAQWTPQGRLRCPVLDGLEPLPPGGRLW